MTGKRGERHRTEVSDLDTETISQYLSRTENRGKKKKKNVCRIKIISVSAFSPGFLHRYHTCSLIRTVLSWCLYSFCCTQGQEGGHMWSLGQLEIKCNVKWGDPWIYCRCHRHWLTGWQPDLWTRLPTVHFHLHNVIQLCKEVQAVLHSAVALENIGNENASSSRACMLQRHVSVVWFYDVQQLLAWIYFTGFK